MGVTVDCPHCGQKTTLGEAYPSAPLATRPAVVKSSPPPPPPPPPAQSPAVQGLGSKVLKRPMLQRPNYVAEAVAYDEEAVKAGWNDPKKKVKTNSGGQSGRWSLIGSLVAIGIIALKFGPLAWNAFLLTDAAAEKLIKESMQETFTKHVDIPKPVTVTKVELREGSGRDRTGTAQVSVNGRNVTLELTAVVSHTGGGTESKWEVSAMEMSKLQGDSPGGQLLHPSRAPPTKMPSVDPVLMAQAKRADELIEEAEATEDAVRELWNRGLSRNAGGLAQLQLIREQIVPRIKLTKDQVEQFQPSSAKLRPVKTALLALAQHNFSSWIDINNAAAGGNWPLARTLFDRMERDRRAFEADVKAAVAAIAN